MRQETRIFLLEQENHRVRPSTELRKTFGYTDSRAENTGLSGVDAPLLTLDGFHEVSRACSKARSQSNGWKSHRQSIPVAVVVISSVEKGDRLDGSLEVKVPMAGKFPVRSAQGASNLTGRSRSEPGSPVKPHLREADGLTIRAHRVYALS